MFNTKARHETIEFEIHCRQRQQARFLTLFWYEIPPSYIDILFNNFSRLKTKFDEEWVCVFASRYVIGVEGKWSFFRERLYEKAKKEIKSDYRDKKYSQNLFRGCYSAQDRFFSVIPFKVTPPPTIRNFLKNSNNPKLTHTPIKGFYWRVD